jgi:hypothetical protein
MEVWLKYFTFLDTMFTLNDSRNLHMEEITSVSKVCGRHLEIDCSSNKRSGYFFRSVEKHNFEKCMMSRYSE